MLVNYLVKNEKKTSHRHNYFWILSNLLESIDGPSGYGTCHVADSQCEIIHTL